MGKEERKSLHFGISVSLFKICGCLALGCFRIFCAISSKNVPISKTDETLVRLHIANVSRQSLSSLYPKTKKLREKSEHDVH